MIMDPNLAAVAVFTLLGLAIAGGAARVTGSFVSPPVVYAALWCGSLAVYYSGLVGYLPIRGGTLAIICGSIAAFVAGGLLPALAGPRSADAAEHPYAVPGDRARAAKITIIVLFVVAVTGSILYYRLLHSLIGIQSLWQNPVLVRMEEADRLLRIGWIGIARSFMIPVFVLTILGRHLLPLERRRGLGAMSAVMFLLALPTGGRTTLITLVAWTFFAIMYSAEIRGEKNPLLRYRRPLLVVALLTFGYFLAVGQILNKTLGDAYGVGQVTRLPRALNGLADIIHYQVGSIPAFERLIDVSGEYEQRSSLTFGMVARALHSVDPGRYDPPQYIQPFVFVPLSTNLYTYLDAFYLDFGWWGIIIFPFVLGILTTSAYMWMRRRPGMLKVYFCALLGVGILQSTGVNRFGNIQFWFWIMVPVLLNVVLLLFVRFTERAGARDETQTVWTSA